MSLNGIISAATNVLSGRAFDQSLQPTPDNRSDRVDQCKCIWYQWSNDLKPAPNAIPSILLPAPTNLFSAARSYDISNHIESFSYSKDMDSAAGSFQLVLNNSYDWSRVMRPGQWITFFLSGKGDLPLPKEGAATPFAPFAIPAALQTVFNLLFNSAPVLNDLPSGPPASAILAMKPYLRCMGIIQRVGIRSNTTPDGATEISYVVTGKDFGVVFEEMELWFNANNADGQTYAKILNAISENQQKNLTGMLDKWFDIFMNPSIALEAATSRINSLFPQQWVLPDKMVEDLGLRMGANGGGTFGDLLGVKEFNATVFEFPGPDPFGGLQGRCWDKLKALSEPTFHELFTEMSDLGNPKLIFRPIPWAMDKSKYPTIGSVILDYKTLASRAAQSPPLPLGRMANAFPSLETLQNAVQNRPAIVNFDDRSYNAVPITAVEVESFDVGPDWHSRSNFYLVDAVSSANAQTNSHAVMSTDIQQAWPIRDEADIKRHGFRPKNIQIQSYVQTNARLFGNDDTATKRFLIEMNYLLKDLWGNAEDFYSGSINLAGGRNDVKLGKTLVTDGSFKGIPNMVFYIEGYADTFSVNGDGVSTWTQAVTVTRGMSQTVLNGGSTKDRPAENPATHHITQNNTAQDSSLLGQATSILAGRRP